MSYTRAADFTKSNQRHPGKGSDTEKETQFLPEEISDKSLTFFANLPEELYEIVMGVLLLESVEALKGINEKLGEILEACGKNENP